MFDPDPQHLRRQRNAAAALVFAMLLAPSAALAQQQVAGTPTEPVVITTGEGVIEAVPDRAWMTVGAESRAGSAREAQRLNTAAMTPVLDKLKAAGITPEAIKT